MDELKDTKVRALLHVLDQNVRNNPFGDSISGERIYRRAERLVAAVFLLTNHIADSESIRAEIRKLALSMLEQIMEARDEIRAASPRLVAIKAVIRRLISLTRILSVAGYASIENVEVVCLGLDDLGVYVENSQRTPLSETIRLYREDLIPVREDYKRHFKDIKDLTHIKDKAVFKDTNPAQRATANEHNNRAQQILDVLRGGSDFSIKDISAHIPEFGEKTVQRDLNRLIVQGAVRRVGLKKWSRYSLAKSPVSLSIQ